jgi:hypothetical protein
MDDKAKKRLQNAQELLLKACEILSFELDKAHECTPEYDELCAVNDNVYSAMKILTGICCKSK